MRAYAAAHFEWDEVLSLKWPDAEAKFQSEYTGGEDGRAYAVTIHGEIRGPGESIEEAEPRLANAIAIPLALLAVASNAAIDDPLAVAAHGVDLLEPQPFVYYRTPAADAWFPPGKRRIDVEPTAAFLHAVGNHAESDLLIRGMESYRRALTYWVPESRLLAGAFLFISAETLSRFLIESRAAQRGLTPKNLARLERVNGEKALRRRYLLDEIFGGDAAALEAMEEASNGFEHGYMAVNDVRGLLAPVLDRSMAHVRRALILASGVDVTSAERLLATEYATPRGLVPVIMVVRGTISREDPSQDPEPMEGAAIELEWTTAPPTAVKTESGDVQISFNEEAKVTKKPDSVRLELSGFGVRAAHVKATEPFRVDVAVTRADGKVEHVDSQDATDEPPSEEPT